MMLRKIFFIAAFISSPAFANGPLSFSDKPADLGWFSSIENKLFAPSNKSTADKETKFPAVVMLPTCAGVSQKNVPTLKKWIKVFVDQGYYVLMVEHLSPRTSQNNCAGRRIVSNDQMVIDTYDAIEHLSKISDIDKNRIFAVGFSLGAQTLGQLASADTHSRLANDRLRPRGVASLYGGCVYKSGQYLFEDSNIPQLWLMGEKDREAPVETCMPIIKNLEEKKTGFQWHVYSEGYHSWDNTDLNGFTKTIRRDGTSFDVTYKYDEKITKDSQQRILDFFKSLN